MTEAPVLHCVNHPDVETTLRCAKCNAPICAKCARRTPTGYICPACQKKLQKKFENARWYDYPISFFVAALGALAGTIPVVILGGFFYGAWILFYAPLAGNILARLTNAALRHRRSKKVFLTSAVGFVLGVLPVIWSSIESLLLIQSFGISLSFWNFLQLIWILVYLLLGISAFYAELTGIRFRL